jgi:hypothetical protein
MTMLFCDSFDHYTMAQLAGKYDLIGTTDFASIVGGRNGGSAMNMSNHNNNYIMAKALPAGSSFVLGMAFKPNGAPGRLFSLYDNATGEQLQLHTDGSILQVRRGGGTLLASGTRVLTSGITYYVEFKFTIANAGSATVKIDTVTEISFSGDTQQQAGATADRLYFWGGDNQNQSFGTMDDLYVCDQGGAQNNDFLGDITVQVLLPDGAGGHTQWTPNASTNFSRVNNATPDDDTTYISDGTAGDRDTYTYGNLRPTTGTVLAIQPVPYARKDDAGVRTIAPVIRIGGVDYDQASLPNLSTTYQFLEEIVELSPATGVAFTVAEVNGAEFGVKMVA